MFQECGPAFRLVQLLQEQRNKGVEELRHALDDQTRACEQEQIKVELARERVAELTEELTAARPSRGGRGTTQGATHGATARLHLDGEVPEFRSQEDMTTQSTPKRRGRAPPFKPYTGENPEMTMDDCLPSLHPVAHWNQWTGDEKLIQLAGHLRGQALQEWNLLARDGQLPFDEMALRCRLEP